jgi:outer membrane protein assembly factor BamB
LSDVFEALRVPAFALGCLLAATATAADWPAFRGGGPLQGRAVDDLPEQPKLLWERKLGGPIQSSAAIVQGTVFVGSDDGKIYALALDTGAVRWSFATGGPVEASPLVRGGIVYVGSSDATFYALDAATGAVRWKYVTEAKILGGANWSPATKAHGERVLVGSYDHKLHCVDAVTGRKVWTFQTENYVHATPAIVNGQAIFGGCDGVLRMVSVETGGLVGVVRVGVYMASSIAVDGTKGFIGHYGNKFLGLDLDDETVLWSYHNKDFPFFSSAALGADRLIFGGRDRAIHCLARDTGQTLWEVQTQGRVDSSPVLVNGKVAVGSADGRVYLLRASDGHKLWSYDVGAAIGASPAVSAGRLVIGAADGKIYAFGSPP